jgi:hypothetical protein
MDAWWVRPYLQRCSNLDRWWRDCNVDWWLGKWDRISYPPYANWYQSTLCLGLSDVVVVLWKSHGTHQWGSPLLSVHAHARCERPWVHVRCHLDTTSKRYHIAPSLDSRQLYASRWPIETYLRPGLRRGRWIVTSSANQHREHHDQVEFQFPT